MPSDDASRPLPQFIVGDALRPQVSAMRDQLAEMVQQTLDGDPGPEPTDDEALAHLQGRLYHLPRGSRWPVNGGTGDIHVGIFAGGRLTVLEYLPRPGEGDADPPATTTT